MQGRIVKALSGFYYVDATDGNSYTCKPRGIFRKDDISPLVGDIVSFDITDTKDMEGSITEISERKSVLSRPPVANVDMALIIFSIKDPDPNIGLLDTFLVSMEYLNIPVVICLNKIDIDTKGYYKELSNMYSQVGYKCICVSAKTGTGIDDLKEALKGKLSSVCGPSGAGKSSIINALLNENVMETGQISKKIKRGKQTTRHSQLLSLGEDTYIADTPGFSSLYLPFTDEGLLDRCFPEFVPYLEECRFSGCSHIHEPQCGVRLHMDNIIKHRYEHYCSMYQGLKEERRF